MQRANSIRSQKPAAGGCLRCGNSRSNHLMLSHEFQEFPTGTIGTMPNKPKTPHRTIRIDDALWSAAQAAAEAEGKTVTDIIRAALIRYVKRSKA